jgi:uncharacterized membrane protein
MVLNKRTIFVHSAYIVTLFIKGFDGAVETLAGIIVGIVGAHRFFAIVVRATANKAAHDPNNPIFHLLRHWFLGLSTTSSSFVAFFLFVNGVLKLAVVISLLWGKRWIFPPAMAIFSVFILYMSYRLTRHWSWWLFGFSLLDLLTLALVANEWRNTGRGGISRAGQGLFPMRPQPQHHT